MNSEHCANDSAATLGSGNVESLPTVFMVERVHTDDISGSNWLEVSQVNRVREVGPSQRQPWQVIKETTTGRSLRNLLV